jgi:hypothetical protein
MLKSPTGSIGGRLALTAILSHFPKLELELELLGSGYNANLMKDEMEVSRPGSTELRIHVVEDPSVDYSQPSRLCWEE